MKLPTDMAGGIPFSKYHGCGNDFIVVGDMEDKYETLFQDPAEIKRMCDRNFGIGGDEVVRIKPHEKYDFLMDNYNATHGVPCRLCGNGSRCGIQFAKDNGIINKDKGTFLACDGPHQFAIEKDVIHFHISDVFKDKIVKYNDDEYFVDVGSPHHIKFVENIETYDVMGEGPKIAFGGQYKIPDSSGGVGAKVNFVEILSEDKCRLRTYERAVEGETKACGTGSVSTAIVTVIKHAARGCANKSSEFSKVISNSGGDLTISFTETIDRFSNVILSGPAKKVFEGTYFVSKR